MKEIWRDVVGYEGLYQVSNYGRVKSLNYNGTGHERQLRPISNRGDYLHVALYKDSKRKQYQIHRLVAQAFISNPDNKLCIDHINTIRTDNRADNLRWATYRENSNNQLTKEHYRISNARNQNGAKKVFCENIIYDSLTQCAEYYKVRNETMSRWLTGKRAMPGDFQAKGLRYYIEE